MLSDRKRNLFWSHTARLAIHDNLPLPIVVERSDGYDPRFRGVGGRCWGW
jgi:hypothetical protein